MGCAYSSGRGGLRVARSSNNSHQQEGDSISLNQRLFHVYNVDEHGNEMHEGAIEVTANDLIYKHVNDPLPIYWPLCSLRKYGYNADLFSFVCGRRCPTGPGIYAFKCDKAMELFELLDESVKGISSANMTASNTSPGIGVARSCTNQRPQYRQISNVSLVSCRNPIALTSNASVTPAVNGSTMPTSHASKLLKSSNVPANENASANGPNDSTSLDNPKSPAYYVNVSTCDAPGKMNNSTGATSQYVNSEAEVFASVQLARASSGSPCSPLRPVQVTSSIIPCESVNSNENGTKQVNNSSATKISIHSVHSSFTSADANSNITSNNNRADESLSYILLDLDSYTSNGTNNTSTGPGNSVYVTTEPVTPVNRSPNEDYTWTLPESTGASVHNSDSNTFRPPYAQIDFEKTDALNTAASIKKI